MDKNDIIKAAKEAIHSHYGCNGQHGCSERDYCQFVNGKNSAYDCCECGADEFNEGFLKCAEWRINSVWHDADKELPEPEIDVLVEYKEEGGNKMYCFSHISTNSEVVKDRYGFCFYIPKSKITRWAYVSDLLPEIKEEVK